MVGKVELCVGFLHDYSYTHSTPRYTSHGQGVIIISIKSLSIFYIKCVEVTCGKIQKKSITVQGEPFINKVEKINAVYHLLRMCNGNVYSMTLTYRPSTSLYDETNTQNGVA